MSDEPCLIAVIGAAECDPGLRRLALEVGRRLASRGATLLCGGRTGVMESAAEGAAREGGRTVGILPGRDARESPPNRFVELPIFTGMGQARNQILVLSARAVIGIGGGWGTLSEIGLALKHRIPVVLLESWDLARPDREEDPLLVAAATPEEAVIKALELISDD